MNDVIQRVAETSDRDEVSYILSLLTPQSIRNICISICKKYGNHIEDQNVYSYEGSMFIIDFKKDDNILILSKKSEKDGMFRIIFYKDGDDILRVFNANEVWKSFHLLEEICEVGSL